MLDRYSATKNVRSGAADGPVDATGIESEEFRASLIGFDNSQDGVELAVGG